VQGDRASDEQPQGIEADYDRVELVELRVARHFVEDEAAGGDG